MTGKYRRALEFYGRLLRHGYVTRCSKPLRQSPVGGAVVDVSVMDLRQRRSISFRMFRDRLFLLTEFMAGGHYLRQIDRIRDRLRQRAIDRPLGVIDAGANVGLFSLFLRVKVADVPMRVVGFEPFSENAELCEGNWRRNGLTFDLRHEALSESSAPGAPLYVLSTIGATINRAEVDAYLEARGARTIPTETVPVSTLDELLPRLDLHQVDLLKLDIEGAEELALRGARETVRRHQPFILCSYEHHQNDKAAIVAIVHSISPAYRVEDDPQTRLLTFTPPVGAAPGH